MRNDAQLLPTIDFVAQVHMSQGAIPQLRYAQMPHLPDARRDADTYSSVVSVE